MTAALIDKRIYVPRETSQSLAAEAAFAGRIEQARGWQLRKLGGSYSPDFVIFKNGSCKGWLELKCRHSQLWGDFPTYMIAVKKWEKCLTLAGTPGIEMPFLLAVAVDDGDYLMNCSAAVLKGANLNVQIGGRKDRNWQEDMEPCVYIPKTYFKAI